jgi:hypothetical protein
VHRLAVTLLAASLTACFPPLRVGAGAGLAGGTLRTVDHQGTPYPHDSAWLGEIRAGFTPLTLVTPPLRHVDVSLGLALDAIAARDGAERHGLIAAPYAELAWFPEQGIAASGWRVGATAALEVPIEEPGPRTGDGVGYGASVGVLAELVSPVDEPAFLGYARGALGIGASLRVGARAIDGQAATYAILAIEVRLPGIAAVPLPPAAPR